MSRGWGMDGTMFGVPLAMQVPWGLHAKLGGARLKNVEVKSHLDLKENAKAPRRTLFEWY